MGVLSGAVVAADVLAIGSFVSSEVNLLIVADSQVQHKLLF